MFGKPDEIEATITKEQACAIWTEDEFATLIGDHDYVDIVLMSTPKGDLSACPVSASSNNGVTAVIDMVIREELEAIVVPVLVRKAEESDWN